jgi:thiol-disulfide isomerase/thioredoxin
VERIDQGRRRIIAGTTGGFILLGAALTLPGAARGGDAGPPIGGSMADFNPIDPPRPIPQRPFLDGKEQPLTLDQFKGRVVLLNFWATWCQPCREEMPSLDRLQAELGGPDFAVVAVSLDEQGLVEVQHFFQMLGIKHLGIYLDPPNAMALALKVKGLPTTILLDREGMAVGSLVGPAEWDTPEAAALMRYYIDKGKPSDTTSTSAT